MEDFAPESAAKCACYIVSDAPVMSPGV